MEHNKENTPNEKNYKYFIRQNKDWSHLDYLNYCQKRKLLRNKAIETEAYKNYLDYVAKNNSNCKKKALTAIKPDQKMPKSDFPSKDPI
ncbi:hypothetical protein F8M41_012423 [Gigaspora margarita]|uniref:Uncharacterized protein n=1 Tax=Gigaspora margarita TaxID=4874 RepID=A0A8H4ASZ7_GIGMA|nr:hypothetical protein F8M41_012423 [Gigaspora margarita]